MDDNSEKSKLVEWYAGQEIFITGATGFMGKVMVEKLLRSCPQISGIHILIRSKKGKDPLSRLEEYLESPIFETVRNEKGEKYIMEKLKYVQGDVTLENCGINNRNCEWLADNITTVFHMAANVRFDQELKTSLILNTGGTKNVLDLACGFRKLKSFVHVSTSYCHCGEVELEERLYKAPHDPLKMLDLVQWMDPEMLKNMTPKLLGDSPNTYAYTKCLTEELVVRYASKLPIAIARPSIVVAVYREPIPGWIEGLNGPTGILIGAGKGVIRTMYGDPECSADYIPVDIAINNILIVGWKIGTRKEINNECEVFHVTADKRTQINWGEILEIGKKIMYENPFSINLWYPGGSLKPNYLLHLISMFFFHLIPAYLVDFLMVLTRNKPFLIQLQKRISNGLNVLEYYTIRNWYFHNEKLTKIYQNELTKKDREIFYMINEDVDMAGYIKSYILGVRKYCLKEDPNNLPQARKSLKRLYYLDLTVKIIFYTCFAWIFLLFATKLLTSLENPVDLWRFTKI